MFVDQSGFYLLPAVVRTYAPVGQTPVLREELSRDHLSAMSGITLEGKLLMMEQERAFKGEDVVRFLKHLGRHIAGKLLVLWDGAPIHRSQVVKEYLSNGAAHRIHLEQLPGYAPELNPVEGLTLLYMSSGLGRVLRGHVLEHGEDLASHIALQAPDDLGLGLALRCAPGQVVPGRLVPAQPDDDDPVQRGVSLAIPAAVQAMAGGLARGGLDRGGPAQH